MKKVKEKRGGKKSRLSEMLKKHNFKLYTA